MFKRKRSETRDALARILTGAILAQTFCVKLGMSSMTASTSKFMGLQQSTSVHASHLTNRYIQQPKSSRKRRKIGALKEKERETNPQRKNWASESEWDHSKAGTRPWSWVPLTEASASKHPPVFTKDGRYVSWPGHTNS